MKNLSIELSNKEELRVFECFAGIGTQHMALRNIGANYKVVGISEIDKNAIKSYNAIHGTTTNFGDISKIDPNQLPDMDLLTYSFPCQDLSLSGGLKGIQEGTRSGLLFECKKIIENKKPKYLLLENVKNLVSKRFKDDFDKWLEYLESIGYTNYWKVLNSKNFGVPQNRERVFCVSILGNQDFKFPDPIKSNIKVKNILERDADQKYYTNKKPYILEIDGDNLYIKQGTKRGISEIDVEGVFNNSYPQSKTRRGRVIDRGNICPTIMIANNYLVIEKDHRVRKLTPKEYWRLQGISDQDFNKARELCSDTQLYKQSGNAISVPVLESIFIELLKGWD